MAATFTYESTFETGDQSEWSEDADANGVLTVRHVSYLARHAGRLEMPYRGAYCLHLDLNGRDTNQYLQHNTAFDLSAGGTLYIRFLVWAKDLVMAASDRFTIFSLQSVGPVDEVVVDIRNNDGTLELLAAETGASATVRATDLVEDIWHTVELAVTVDSGGGDGTIDFYVDGYQIGTQITTLTQGAITQARIGAIGVDAGTTAGHLLFDQIVADDARVYPFARRFVQTVDITKSGHVAIGPGQVLQATLKPGAATDCVMTGWDTNIGNTTGHNKLFEDANAAASVPMGLSSDFFVNSGRFNNGLYVQLSGTNPSASVTFDLAMGMSAAGVRQAILQREAA